MDKDTKKKYGRRILNDEILRNMDNIHAQIKDYKTYMDKESFKESKEVEELYTQLRELGLELFYIGTWSTCSSTTVTYPYNS